MGFELTTLVVIGTDYHSHFRAGSLIADHVVVSNQTNSQPNVIAAVDNLIKGVTNVTIQGVFLGCLGN
jgi:N-acetyl-gamma-glutamylphosphate reductase